MKIDKIVTDDYLIEFLLDQHEQTKNPVFLAAANSIWLYRRGRSVLNYSLSELNEWISVEDRLPEEKGEYLVTYHPCWWDDVKYDEICVGMDSFRGKTSWAKRKFQRVTHWRPLPKPPKG